MAVGIPGIGVWANGSEHVKTCSAQAGAAERRPGGGQPFTLDWPGRKPRQTRQAISRQLAHAG
jgi:hypothetical protein